MTNDNNDSHAPPDLQLSCSHATSRQIVLTSVAGPATLSTISCFLTVASRSRSQCRSKSTTIILILLLIILSTMRVVV